jgi:TolB-like protein/DNA-binding winged helix-turn-helix (wHTH) protein/tetratricopeptide (TPR) repeat protein
MSTPNPYESIVRFSVFELDFPGRVLRKSGMRLRCQGQPLQVLAALLEKPGVLVTREELRQRVWPEDTFVDFDHALNTAIKKLRGVLNDDADTPRYIETVHRRGYRFIGPIHADTQLASNAKPEPVASPPALSTDSSPPDRNAPYRHAIAVGLLGVAFASLVIYYFNFRHAKASATSAVPPVALVAVLPFQNMTNDASQESFADGMTEETTTHLARLNSPRFHVIARTSAMKYKGVREGVDEIARELHADYLLEGAVRREGSQVRVTCQLIRAADQSPRWTQEYNFDSGDSLTLQTRVADTITRQMNAMLGDPSVPHHPMNDHDFDSYLRGLAESSIHTPEGLDRIIATFQQAVVDDPDCSQPLAGLAHVYERGANLGFLPPRVTYAKARDAAERAIKINSYNPESYVYLADAILTIDYDWKGAGAEIQKALDLNANDPMAHEWNSVFLFLQNKTEPALQEIRRAVELDPLNAERKVFLAKTLEQAGYPVEAEEELKAALQLDPASVLAHSSLLMLYRDTGRQREAISEWSAIFFLEGEPESADQVRALYGSFGFDVANHFALTQSLAHLKRLRSTRYVSAFRFARVYEQLGEKEQAVQWLQKAYEARDVEVPCLPNRLDRYFDSVKNDPRVVAIVEKVRPPR